ncbi:hemerythrin domain-containing protein, partial [Kitasatospora sp. NPDC001175]
MGHGGNVIEELMADHREVDEIFSRLQAMTGRGQELRDLVDEVTIELVRHSVAEEQ